MKITIRQHYLKTLLIFTFSILLTGAFISSCSSSDDSPPVDMTDDSGTDPTDDTTDDDDAATLVLMTVQRGPNLLSNQFSSEPTEVRIVATSETGEVLDDQIVAPNSSVTLTTTAYEPGRPYDFHVIYKERLNNSFYNNARIYRIYTIPNAVNQAISLDLKYNTPPVPGSVSSSVGFLGLVEPLEEVFASYRFSFTTQEPSSVDNNRAFIRLPEDEPTNVLFYGKKEDDPQSKAVFFENVNPGANVGVFYEDIGFVEVHPLANSTPFSTRMYGLKDGDIYRYLFRTQPYTGDEITRFEVPLNVGFDDYLIEGNATAPGGVYSYRYKYGAFSVLPDEITLPELTATVNSNDISNYEMTTSGQYDYYRINYEYFNGDRFTGGIPITEGIDWDVIGPDDETVSFSLPDIISLLLDSDPEVSYTLSDLSGGFPIVVNSDELAPSVDLYSYLLDERIQFENRFIDLNSYRQND